MTELIDREEFAEELRITTPHGNTLATIIEGEDSPITDLQQLWMELLLEVTVALSFLLKHPTEPEALEEAQDVLHRCNGALGNILP